MCFQDYYIKWRRQQNMKLTKANENLELLIPDELLPLKVFERLIKKPRKKTDAPAIKELNYIYHMCNPASNYFNYNENEERHNKLVKDLFNEDWKISKEVNDAMVEYRELIKTPSLHVVDTMLGSLHECNDIVSEITKQLKEDLKAGKHKSGINNKRGQIVSGVEMMLNDLTALLKVSKEIPNHIDTLEKLFEKLKSEQTKSTSRVKGGAYISDREK